MGRRAIRARRLRRAAAVGALLAAVVVAWQVVRGATDPTYTLHATFDDVRGLVPGADVRAGAVKIGTVEDIALGRGDRPRVTMTVDQDVRLHVGATADIRLASNVGSVNRTVELTEGDPTAPRLRDGDRLSRARTDQPVNFDDAVDLLDRPTRARAGRLLGGLDAATEDRGDDLDRLVRLGSPALSSTAGLLAEVSRDGAALRTAVADGQRVVSALAARPDELGTTATRVAGLLDATAARRAEIRGTVAELAPSLRAGRRTLDAVTEATPTLRRAVAQTGPLVDAVGPFVRTLPTATGAAAPLMAESRRLVEGGPAQLRDLVPIARAASPVARKLEPVARKALPLARVLQVYIPETVGAFQNFGATAGAYDANGHVLNVAAGVTEVMPPSVLTGGEVGAGECDKGSTSGVKPGLLKKPFIRLPGVNECQPWTDLPDGIVNEAKGGGSR